LEVAFGGPESPVVFKVVEPDGSAEGYWLDEFDVLRHYREHAGFPVSRPLFQGVSDSLPFLILERVPGRNLADAAPTLTAVERISVERGMGEAVAKLHLHTHPQFGSLRHEETWGDWAGCFHEQLRENVEDVEKLGLLSAKAMVGARRVVDDLPRLLDAPGDPVLVHGDLWATNVMVDNGRLSGFLDPTGHFYHREFDLAYLQLWQTVGPAFFDAYHEVHPRLEGYERRKVVYWLNTLLLHVWLFKTEGYVRRTERFLADPSLLPPRRPDHSR
jgi:fructosamine-3-kinase